MIYPPGPRNMSPRAACGGPSAEAEEPLGHHKPNKPTVVGLGELLWDVLPDGRRMGGAPANFAYHAHQLGAAGWVCSAIGRDESGDRLLQNVQELGVNLCLERVERPTGWVDVKLDDGEIADHAVPGALLTRQ